MSDEEEFVVADEYTCARSPSQTLWVRAAWSWLSLLRSLDSTIFGSSSGFSLGDMFTAIKAL
jgi:hypothetical protein